MEGVLVDVEGLVHIYRTDELEVVALQGLDLQVAEQQMIAIVPRSGSGKTTLMNVLAGVEAPSAGRAQVAGYDLARMTGAERASYRRPRPPAGITASPGTAAATDSSSSTRCRHPSGPARVPPASGLSEADRHLMRRARASGGTLSRERRCGLED